MSTTEVEKVGKCLCNGPLRLTAKRASVSDGQTYIGTKPPTARVTTIKIACDACGLLYDSDHMRFAHECDHVRVELALTDPDY